MAITKLESFLTEWSRSDIIFALVFSLQNGCNVLILTVRYKKITTNGKKHNDNPAQESSPPCDEKVAKSGSLTPLLLKNSH